jgi:hypothetical protein
MFTADLIPLVTGRNSSLALVANMYDPFTTFKGRGRANSVKPHRTVADAIFDLSVDYPGLTPPERKNLNTEKVKSPDGCGGVGGGRG